MDIKLIEQLENMGLQNNEAAIYLALLELGQGTVTEISKKARLNRTTGYDILERLCLNGLANRSNLKKKRIYVAEPPSRLKQHLENKKNTAERCLKELEGLLPDLSSLYKTELKPTIKFAEGKQEMINMYLRQLETKDTIYSILNLKGYAEDFGEMGTITSEARFKKGIKEKVLALKNETAIWWWNHVYKGKPKRQEYTEYRWLEPTMKNYPNGEIMIYDNTVLTLLTKPGEYIAFEMTSQSLAAFLKIMFEIAWQQAKKIND